jgi:phosphatidate cytidylyltransferase
MSKLLERTLIGSGLVVFVIIALYGPRELLTVFSILWILLATREFLNLLKKQEIILPQWLILALNGLFPIVYYFTNSFLYYLLFPLIVFFYAVFKKRTLTILVSQIFFIMFYLGFLPSHLLYLKHWALQNFEATSIRFWIILYPLAFTWIHDSAGYIIGSLIGKHRLAPQLSPKKTIEGEIAGVTFGFLMSFFYLRAVLGFSVLSIIGLSIILSIGALVGDLLESGFKREAQLKDSSNLLGAHGGFLDRIDSLLLTIPLYYYLIKLFLR